MLTKNVGKLIAASTAKPVDAEYSSVNYEPKTANVSSSVSDNHSKSLIWVSGYFNGKQLPAIIDSGAIPCCIALRCVLNSPKLKCIMRQKYIGDRIIDANGNPVAPEFVIFVPLMLGQPAFSVTESFIVVKDLPFSCIIGQTLLNKLNNWSVDNKRHLIFFNKTTIIPFSSSTPVIHSDSIQFITTSKCIIAPGERLEISTRATGPQLLPFRPITIISSINDISGDVTARLGLEIMPSLAFLTHNNCPAKFLVYNKSDIPKTIKKRMYNCKEYRRLPGG